MKLIGRAEITVGCAGFLFKKLNATSLANPIKSCPPELNSLPTPATVPRFKPEIWPLGAYRVAYENPSPGEVTTPGEEGKLPPEPLICGTPVTWPMPA